MPNQVLADNQANPFADEAADWTQAGSDAAHEAGIGKEPSAWRAVVIPAADAVTPLD